MSKNIGFILIAGTLSLIAVDKGWSNDASQPILVEAVSLKKKQSTEVTYLTGEVRARVQSDLSFRVSGRIVERYVEVGDTVKAGDLLARLDAEEQRADIAVARANLESAQAQEKLAELSLERQRNLLKTRVTTQAAIDQALEDLATSKENVLAATAQFETAERQFSFTDLRAEAEGVITARMVEVGQVARAAQPVFTLARTGARDAVFDVQEALYLERQPGGDLQLALVSDPKTEFSGKIREVSPTIDELTGTIKVKVDLGVNQAVPLGAAIVGSFVTPTRPVLEVPWSAMASVGDVPAVWIVDPASLTASLRKVAIGKHTTTAIEVTKGIGENDIVVVEGGKFLAPGRKVSVKTSAGEPL